jgi:hypothetical protein
MSRCALLLQGMHIIMVDLLFTPGKTAPICGSEL